MERIDPSELTVHLEAALMMTPPETLAALQGTDRPQRHRAVNRLAGQLAERLRCFDIRFSDMPESETFGLLPEEA